MDKPHLFIHSLDRHVGCLQFLVIKNKVAMSIYEQVFLWTYSFLSLGKDPEIEWLDHMVGSFFFFF